MDVLPAEEVVLTEAYLKLYQAALLADQHYAEALKKAYGRKACNMRYRSDVNHPPEVERASQRKLDADDALHAAWMVMHNSNAI